MSDIVPTTHVIPAGTSSEWSIKKMMEVLNRQGQIEPLQVTRSQSGAYITFMQDAHGSDIAMAAKRLGWPTLLVVVGNRYEY